MKKKLCQTVVRLTEKTVSYTLDTIPFRWSWDINVDQAIIDFVNTKQLDYVQHTTRQDEISNETVVSGPWWRRTTTYKQTYALEAIIWYWEHEV